MRLGRSTLATPFLIILCLALGALATTGQGMRLALSIGLSFVFFGVGFRSPQQLILLLVVWLSCLGTIRRVTVGAYLFGLVDPLLLVAPISLLVLTLRGKSPLTGQQSPLTKLVLLLQTLTVLSALNPMQGSPAIGLTGVFFVSVPMLGFWIGRSFANDENLIRTLKLVAGLSIPVAIYGLTQTLVRFPSWDERWINAAGYNALNVGGAIRSFSSFSSASEYYAFIAIGLITWIAFTLRKRPVIALPAACLIFVALVYGAQRSIMVTLLFAAGLVIAARRGLSLGGAAIASVSTLVSLPFLLSYLSPNLESIQESSPLLEHQIEGLADPFGERSTLTVHLDMSLTGFKSLGFNPLGSGIGSITIGSTKFGESTGQGTGSTEVDPSNVAVALGFPGLIIYLGLLFIAFRKAYIVAAQRRDPLSTAVLAILATMIFQWFNGGQYAVVWLPWLLLGWLDRTTGSARTSHDQAKSETHVAHGSARYFTYASLHLLQSDLLFRSSLFRSSL